MATNNNEELNGFTVKEILILAKNSKSIHELRQKIYKGRTINNRVKILEVLEKNNFSFKDNNLTKSELSNAQRLNKVVKNSYSFSQVLESFNLVKNGGNYNTLKKYILKFNIDIRHFDGRPISRNDKLCEEKIFCQNSPKDTQYVKTIILKENLITYKCRCGLEGIWQGKPLTLQLEHKNGDNKDHRLENLEFLCPNCHTQTATYCSKNRKFRLNKLKESLPYYKKPNRIEMLFNSQEKKQLLLENLKNFKNFEDLFKHYNIKNNSYSVRMLNQLLLEYKLDKRMVNFNRNISENKIIKEKIRRSQPKFTYPPIPELLLLINQSNLTAVSKKIGCTANGLKKHLKKHDVWVPLKNYPIKP